MENCSFATSVNSVLLLKERIIKVETLLEKYASLARRFNELEKSHSQLSENERTARKDAAKFLEKYCKLSKKCSTLLSKIKTLEEEVKDKTNQVTEHQDELRKLDSVLKIYRLERKNYENLKRDKNYLLSLAWRLFKDSGLESKENKNRKSADVFFKRFDTDLGALKLYDFRSRKLKKISPEAEELETDFSPVVLPVSNSVESDFIDIDVTAESAKSICIDEIDNFDEQVQESKVKPSETCIVEKHEYDMGLFAEIDCNYQSHAAGINDLFIELNSEKCVNIKAKDLCFDVNSSAINISSNNSVPKDGGSEFTGDIKHSACPPILQEQFGGVGVTNLVQIEKNEYDDISLESCMLSTSRDKSEVKPSESKGKSLNFTQLDEFPAPTEDPEFKTVAKNRYLSCKQYKRKRVATHTVDTDKYQYRDKPVEIEETTCVNKDRSENSNEIIGQNIDHINKGEKNLSGNLNGKDKVDMNEHKENENDECSLLRSGENDKENPRVDEEKSNNGNFELQEKSQHSSGVSEYANGELLMNAPTEVTQEPCLLFNSNENREKISNEYFGSKGCEVDPRHVSNPNSISNKEMKLLTVDLKKDSNVSIFGTSLQMSSKESLKEISDEKIFDILKNFKTVRLISPLKETPRKRVSKRPRLDGELRPQRCLINNFNDVVETKTKKDVERVQVSNRALCLADGLSEKSTKVDDSTQTDDLLTNEDKETKQEQNVKLDKPVTIPVTKGLVRQVFRKIWNGKLKKKLKNLDELTKIWKTHPCCFMFLKSIVQNLCVHSVDHEKYEKDVVCNLMRNNFKSRYKSKIRAVKKRLSSWHVEDTTVTDMVPNKSQYLFGCDGEINNYIKESSIFNNVTKDLINSHLPPGKDQLVNTQNLGWFSTQKSDYVTQRYVFENKFKGGLPGSIFHGVALKGFKKENENFKSFSISNYNCSGPFFGGDYNMIDMKDNQDFQNTPKPVIECDRVMPAEDGSAEESECPKRSEDSRDTEQKPLEVQKFKLVPRRSSRIQGRLKVINTSPKYVSESPSSPERQSGELNSVVCSNNASSPASPAGCTQPENSTIIGPALEEVKSSECLENKYKLLFGETGSSEPSENNCDEVKATDISSPPKACYNLRQKTIANVVGSTGNPVVGGKRRACSIRNTRLPQRIAKSLESDYFSSEEENKESETLVEEPLKEEESNCLLDSIMTAMTKQTEKFKPKVSSNQAIVTDICEVNGAAAGSIFAKQLRIFPPPIQEGIGSTPRSYTNSDTGSVCVNFTDSSSSEKQIPNESNGQRVEASGFSSWICHEGNKMKKLVENEIRKFLKVEIKSVEDGEEKLKPCIAVLEKAGEDVIANAIVAEVMANVDEELQDFDRPAPPLTQTQHRLMIILTMLTKSSERLSKINYKILNTIWSKLFPDTFFWPDDTVEMASRFYSALCKKINYFKGIWRFCFKAVSCMRQRWCIPIFVVFQVWPDILHNATEIQDNILVNTFVNVILHSPKSEALRRKRQEGKLLAIKHLLINFYNFQINITIEQLTQQLFQSLLSNTPGSSDALIFVSRCRQWTWLKKNIIPPLIETLTNWSNGTVIDECGFKTLDIVQQISTVLPVDDNATPPSAKNMISALYQLLGSSNSNSYKEQKIIRTLCSFAHHTGVKEILQALSNKFPSQDLLHLEIKEAISTSCRKRRQLIKNSKNIIKMEAKFKKKNQEMKKKKKRVKKKKKKVKVATTQKFASTSAKEVPTALADTTKEVLSSI